MADMIIVPGRPDVHGISDNKVHNRRYRVFFASGDWTCSMARFTGNIKGSMICPTER